MSIVKNKQRGFTLIEIMVSVSIFVVVMLSATTAYLTLISLDKNAQATNDIVDNLSFALDSMSRNIRTGTNYDCLSGSGGNCPAGGTQFEFTDENGCVDEYFLSNNEIQESENVTGVCSGPTDNTAALTDSRIQVDTLMFYVNGVGTSDDVQPNVTFVLHGSLVTDSKHVPVTFDIQTSATERGIDI